MKEKLPALRRARFIYPLRATGTSLQGVGARHAQMLRILRVTPLPLRALAMRTPTPFLRGQARTAPNDENFSHHPASDMDKATNEGRHDPAPKRMIEYHRRARFSLRRELLRQFTPLMLNSTKRSVAPAAMQIFL